jgi:hypothetical protein
VWSLRRFNPFCARFIGALPGVAKTKIVIFVQSPNDSTTFRPLILRDGNHDGASNVFVAARLIGANQRHSTDSVKCYHASALSEINAYGIGNPPLANGNNDDLDLSVFDVCDSFGGSESEVANTSPCKEKASAVPAFNWSRYLQELEKVLGLQTGEASSAADDEPMSIYGNNVRVMKAEHKRLTRLIENDPDIEQMFGSTANHLLWEIDRLETMQGVSQLQSQPEIEDVNATVDETGKDWSSPVGKGQEVRKAGLSSSEEVI